MVGSAPDRGPGLPPTFPGTFSRSGPFTPRHGEEPDHRREPGEDPHAQEVPRPRLGRGGVGRPHPGSPQEGHGAGQELRAHLCRARHQERGGEEAQGSGEEGRAHLPRARPRPRGRGDRLAHRRGARPRRRRAAPRHLQRDHPERGQEGARAPGQDRSPPGRRPAGPARPRPADGLQALASPLGQGQARPLGRTRAVGRAEDGLRPPGRDRRLRPGGVLDPGRPPGGRRPARVPRPPPPDRRPEGEGRERRAGGGDRERDHRRTLPGRGDRAQGVEAAPVAALHHQPAPAGGGAPLRLQREADDGHRPGALRRARDRRAGPARPHHLHAHRLDARRRRGARRRARAHPRRLRGRDAAREAERLRLEEGRPGRPRGDPADLPRPAARRDGALARGRRAQALPADLGALRRQPDAAGGLRRHPGRRRTGAADAARDGQDPQERRLPVGLPGGRREARERRRGERRDAAAARRGRNARARRRREGAEVHPAAAPPSARRRWSRRSRRAASAGRRPTPRSSRR